MMKEMDSQKVLVILLYIETNTHTHRGSHRDGVDVIGMRSAS